ncbi:MAG: hypothetical protein K8T26_11370 [Lentisphaerae bacterium]|nr:hypothetical protein [Lentisphaerota bacterium]
MSAAAPVRYPDIDYDWRPSSYWAPPADALHVVLRNVKGTRRRQMIRDYWNAGRFQELEDALLQDELTVTQRESLGRIHPTFMGGEYLPRTRRGEVTLVRVDLKSANADVIEVRAASAGKRIRYRVVDEYNTRFPTRPRSSARPLTLGQLVDLVDHASPAYDFGESLGLCYTASNYECGGCTLDDLEDFTSVSSDIYPELSTHYHRVQEEWFEARRRELVELGQEVRHES